MPETRLEWRIPRWSNTLERNRARTYFQAYAAAVSLHFIEKALAEVAPVFRSAVILRDLEGLSYEEALRQAQQLGYAEADPTLDVDGTDTAHKLAILAQLAFEIEVRPDSIPRQGID